jgi:hypothetical protein
MQVSQKVVEPAVPTQGTRQMPQPEAVPQSTPVSPAFCTPSVQWAGLHTLVAALKPNCAPSLLQTNPG